MHHETLRMQKIQRRQQHPSIELHELQREASVPKLPALLLHRRLQRIVHKALVHAIGLRAELERVERSADEFRAGMLRVGLREDFRRALFAREEARADMGVQELDDDVGGPLPVPSAWWSISIAFLDRSPHRWRIDERGEKNLCACRSRANQIVDVHPQPSFDTSR